MKFKKIYILLFIFPLILSGCKKKENKEEIIFIENENIEYSSDFKISSLVEKVENYDKNNFQISKDDTIITLPNGEIIEVNTTGKEIKLDTIKFTFRYKNKNYIKEITVQDTEAPNIKAEDNYKVELDNKYFDIENIISCTDNYTNKNDIEVFFNGNYDISKTGTYDVEIIAYDEKKNKALKNIKIIVEEKEKVEVVTKVENPVSEENEKVQSSQQDNSVSSQNSSSESRNNNQVDSNTSVSNNNFIPESKIFHIDNYGTFDECLKACQSYISECMQKGYTGQATSQPIKNGDIYIGYQAIFN